MEEQDKLCSLIKGGLLHITSLDGYRGILRDRLIKPNDGSRPYTYRKCGVCHLIGAVALVGLKLGKEPLFGPGASGLWMGLLTRHKPITFVLHLDRSRLPGELRLLTFDDRARFTEAPYHGQMLPDSEVCYPGSIPISAVKRCILVDYWDSADFEDHHGFQLPETTIRAMICRLASKPNRA